MGNKPTKRVHLGAHVRSRRRRRRLLGHFWALSDAAAAGESMGRNGFQFERRRVRKFRSSWWKCYLWVLRGEMLLVYNGRLIGAIYSYLRKHIRKQKRGFVSILLYF